MSDDPTREEVLASIVAKSDQLNSEDLIASGPITVTVAGVRRGTKEQPIQIDLVERDRPFRPCKTVRRCLIALWSDDPKAWVGQRMTIYTDPDIVYAGVRVGGLRVSHASGIEAPRTFLLTQSRGKRSEVTIRPIKPQPPNPHAEYITAARAAIAKAANLDDLKVVGEALKDQPPGVQDVLRPVYAARREELRYG